MEQVKILIIEDDLLSRITLSERLKAYGKVFHASSSEEARVKLKSMSFDVAFVDLDLDRILEGIKLLPLVKENKAYPVVLSAREEDDIIRAAYDAGCRDYLVKPFSVSAIELVWKKFRQQDLKSSIRKRIEEKLMTSNEKFLSQVEIISNSLLSEEPILIEGESGTGKTFLAKLIHEFSGENLPFIQVNCSEFSENLLESELFGHVAGSFTGATKAKKGVLELCNGGILFLDEIATMSVSLQKKILKAIEEKEFYPVGSEKMVKTHFRLISATCDNLKRKVELGEFRQDLYFRIEGFNVYMTPLRERRDDIPALVKYFNKRGDRRLVFDQEALRFLMDYAWPGNIREMQKLIDILRTKDQGIVTLDALASLNITPRRGVPVEGETSRHDLNSIKEMGLNAYLENVEVQILQEVLKENKDKVRKTLTDLKISNNSYYRIMGHVKNNGSSHVGQ